MNSLRGFDWRDISSYDKDGNEIGGDKFLQFNVELIYPIFKDAGFVALVFFDTGDVYSANDDVDLGKSAVNLCWGLDQNAVTLATYNQTKKYIAN